MNTIQTNNVVSRDAVYLDLLHFAVAANANTFDAASIVKSLNRVIDYQHLLQRLIPLLCLNAAEHNLLDKLTTEVQFFLNNSLKSQTAFQLAYNSQLLSMIDLCAKHKIPVVLLKGAALNGTAYSVNVFRTASDIDIWVSAEYWVYAESIFRKFTKYKSKIDEHVFGDLYELTFVPKNGPAFEIDMHSHLTHPQLFTIDYQELWSTRQAHPLYDRDCVSVLSSECAIIHQAIHAYNDMDFFKYNVCDTYMLIINNTVNWETLIQTSQRYSTNHIVFILLTKVNEVFEMTVPSFVLNALSPNKLLKKIGQHLLASKHGNVAHGKTMGYRLHQLLSQYVFTQSFYNPLQLQLYFAYKWLQKSFLIRHRF